MIQGHLSPQNHSGIAPGLATPTLSMVGFKCHLPREAGFEPGPPSKRNHSRPFGLPEFDASYVFIRTYYYNLNDMFVFKL